MSLITYKTLHIITLCILLITPKPIKSTFDISPLNLNIIICLTSCCIGATMYALIQKYLYTQPVIIPTPNKPKKTNISQKLFKQQCKDNFTELSNQIQMGYANQKEIVNSVIKQNNTINNLRTQLGTLSTKIDILTQEHNAKLGAEATLFNELDTFCKTHNTVVPVICALYWAHKSFIQKQELKEIKQSYNNTKRGLLTHL